MTKQQLHSLVLSVRSGKNKLTYKQISEVIETMTGEKISISTLSNWAAYDTYDEYCSDMKRRVKASTTKIVPKKEDARPFDAVSDTDMIITIRELSNELLNRLR